MPTKSETWPPRTEENAKLDSFIQSLIDAGIPFSNVRRYEPPKDEDFGGGAFLPIFNPYPNYHYSGEKRKELEKFPLRFRRVFDLLIYAGTMDFDIPSEEIEFNVEYSTKDHTEQELLERLQLKIPGSAFQSPESKFSLWVKQANLKKMTVAYRNLEKVGEKLKLMKKLHEATLDAMVR